MTTLLHDLRFAARALRRKPSFAVAAILTLSLGIGANTAVFSVVAAVLLRPLPYPEPDRLVVLWGADRLSQRNQVSATDVEDYRRQVGAFLEVATFADWNPLVSGAGDPERLAGIQVGDGFFTVLGVEPQLGRAFTLAEQIEGQDQVIVLGHEMWRQRFGADPAVVGRELSLNGLTYEVIGVMPPGVPSLPGRLLEQAAQFYRPVAEPYDDAQRASRHLRAIARLRPGVSLAAAQAEVEAVARRLQERHPDQNAGYGIRLVTLEEEAVAGVGPILILVQAAVVVVLLVVCVNVACLLLARAAGRRREVALRIALGAGAARLARLLLTESALLALLGGALGLVWAGLALEALGRVSATAIPELAQSPASIDGRVLAFTLTLSLLASFLFGFAPSWRLGRTRLAEALKQGSRRVGVGRRSPGHALVVAEIALSLVLLVTGGLLVRSFQRLYGTSPGFASGQQLVMDVWLPWALYREPAKSAAFYRDLLARVEPLPGVLSAGLVSTLPLRGHDDRTIELEGRPMPTAELPAPDSYFVSPDYLRAMAIPLVTGRGFDARDEAESAPVVLVNREMASRLWPAQDPLGKRLRLRSGRRVDGQFVWRTVVGVVGDVRQDALDEPTALQLYLPQTQMPWTTMTLVVKAAGDPLRLADPIRREIRALDAGLAPSRVARLEQVVADSVAIRRLGTWLVASFALLTLGLGAIGLFGVVSYWVAQRTSEVGLRMALGARPRDVVRLVVGQGARLAAAGLALGLVAGAVAGRAVRGFLYQTSSADPLILAGVPALLAAVALLASYLPARRASRVDPLVALREE